MDPVSAIKEAIGTKALVALGLLPVALAALMEIIKRTDRKLAERIKRKKHRTRPRPLMETTLGILFVHWGTLPLSTLICYIYYREDLIPYWLFWVGSLAAWALADTIYTKVRERFGVTAIKAAADGGQPLSLK